MLGTIKAVDTFSWIPVCDTAINIPGYAGITEYIPPAVHVSVTVRPCRYLSLTDDEKAGHRVEWSDIYEWGPGQGGRVMVITKVVFVMAWTAMSV